MAKKELTELTDAELVTALADSKEELFKLRFQLATGQLENTSLLKASKKSIAKANTEIRSREIAAAEAQANAEGES